jgi:hypothetical protein
LVNEQQGRTTVYLRPPGRLYLASEPHDAAQHDRRGPHMPDAVTHWNDVLLKVIRQVGGSPCPIARAGAMMHAAIYDAVNSIVPTHEPYVVQVPANPTASVDAAIAHAAHDTLAAAFPGTTVDLAQELTDFRNALSASASATEIAAGKAVGRAAAQAMIADRAADGSQDNSPYPLAVPPRPAGDWEPTDGEPAVSPNWPNVKPFCMTSGDQFRPPLPGGYASKAEMLRSEEYAAQLDEVMRLGRHDATERTDDQTDLAFFWANDLNGTYKPPGQLFEITQIVSEQKGLDVIENARLFALVALAMGDAAVVAWDAKYATYTDLWRPYSAIRRAAEDDNPATTPDESWEPLSVNPATNDRFSPSFPAYISGHATFGAAHASIMRRYFGTDNVRFTATTEDPNLPADVTRTFNSFTDAALENARSRIYLGVHFQWDGDHGFQSGTALGEHVFATRLLPLAA